jgi:GNAT superfamily N-acetyltransferase
VIVDPKQRGKGIGSALVKKLEDIARQNGIVSLDLLAYNQAKALSFWDKQGFKPNGYIQMMKRF